MFCYLARRRRAYLSLRRPLAGLLQLLDLAFDDLALERRHLVEKDYAVTVVRFVQHSTRRQLGAVDFEFVSVDVVRSDNRAQIALDAEVNTGKGKTAFFAILFAFHADHFRVDHDDTLRRVFAARAIHHKQTLGHSDLYGGQPDTRRRVHRLEHILDELFQIAVKFRNRISRRLENWIRPGDYFQKRHSKISSLSVIVASTSILRSRLGFRQFG